MPSAEIIEDAVTHNIPGCWTVESGTLLPEFECCFLNFLAV